MTYAGPRLPAAARRTCVSRVRKDGSHAEGAEDAEEHGEILRVLRFRARPVFWRISDRPGGSSSRKPGGMTAFHTDARTAIDFVAECTRCRPADLDGSLHIRPFPMRMR